MHHQYVCGLYQSSVSGHSSQRVSVWFMSLISYPYTYTSDREAHTRDRACVGLYSQTVRLGRKILAAVDTAFCMVLHVGVHGALCVLVRGVWRLWLWTVYV